MTNGSKPKIGQVLFKDFRKDLPMEQVYISPQNTRKTEKEDGLPEIEGSIDRIGLIQPIVVIQRDDKFECVAGQRRFLALKALGKKYIPALIMDDMSEIAKSLVSFGENIHRRELPYSDTIDVVSKLFDAYSGSKDQKVNQILADLGLPKEDVIEYLSAQLVPKSLQKMVDDGTLTDQKAHDITAAFWPDEKEMLTIANQMGGLTAAEFKRALQIKREKPNEKVQGIIEEAKKPSLLVTFRVTVSRNEADMLESEAARRSRKLGKKVTVSELIHAAIKRFFTSAA